MPSMCSKTKQESKIANWQCAVISLSHLATPLIANYMLLPPRDEVEIVIAQIKG